MNAKIQYNGGKNKTYQKVGSSGQYCGGGEVDKLDKGANRFD